MKIILKQNVKGVGKQHEVKDVADGYGRNFLIARGLAEIATSGAMSKLEHLKNKALGEATDRADRESKLAKELMGKEFKITRKANEKGHLFESAHSLDIEKLVTASGVKDAFLAKVDLPEPIKSTGKHEIKLQMGESKSQVILEVTPE